MTKAERRRPRLVDYLLALLIALVSAGALGYAQQTQGVVRDEATYFEAAESYWGWFDELIAGWKVGDKKRALKVASVKRYWQKNSEHPALLKSAFALSWRAFGKSHAHTNRAGARNKPAPLLPLMSEISAFRLPTWIFTAFAVALIYLFGVRIESRIAGITAALLYITMPRVFFHGQLACFDSAITTMCLLVVYAYFRALTRARWSIIAGIAFGLALATKHNAWFIPVLLLIHYLVVVWPDVSLRPLALPRIPLVFVMMAILGPLVFYAHWPWLWFDTVDHVRQYFTFHLNHVSYPIEFGGKNYMEPPFPIAYPFAMTLYTVPTIALVLALAGTWIYIRPGLISTLASVFPLRQPRYDDPFRFPARRSWTRPADGLNPRLGYLFLLNALFPLVLIAIPSTPIFGATKHWLTAYPFFALFAGVALSRITTPLWKNKRSLRPVIALLPLLVAAPGAINTALTHPFGLSQYNALAGGVAGGADKGLNRQFWGYSPRQVLPWLNDNAPDNAKVYFHDVNFGSYRTYIRNGLLRPDIRYAGMELPAIRASQLALNIHELHFNKYDYWIWEAYGSPIPAHVLTLDSVPLVSVYKRPDLPITP